MKSALIALVLFAAAAARAEDTADAGTPANESTGFSEELYATVPGEKDVVKVPQAVDVVKRSDLRRTEGIYLDDALNLLPGVRFESRTPSGGQRITIRGYGNSTNFNGAGYKAYLDGIPLTDAEGTTILNDVDPSTLGKIEVIKGPNSSLYGAGIGGVVLFSTLKPEPDSTVFTQEVIGGSESLLRTNSRVEHADADSSLLLNYGHQRSDGTRVNNEGDRDYAMLTGTYKPNSKQSLSVYAAYDHAFDHLPGEMTAQQFLSRDQNYSDPQYTLNRAHIAIDGARVGASHRYQFTDGLSNTTSVFATEYQLDQPTAVNLGDNSVVGVGGRTELAGSFGMFDAMIGTEIQRSNAFKKSYGLTNGVMGGIRTDLQVTSLVSDTFLQGVAHFPLEIDVTAGASLDYVRYALVDRLANSANPGHLSQSGTLTFDPVIAPRLAVLKSFGQNLSVYAQVSEGFTPPASGAVVIPQTGQVNTSLKPERGTQFEIGSKGFLFDGRFSYEAALFDLVVQDKLTPQTITDSFGTYTVTTNAGKQNDVGLELAARYALFRSSEGPLRLLQVFGSYAYSSFHYDGFKSDANNNAKTVDYSGNKVVGVPPHVVSGGLDLSSRWGLYLTGTVEHVSPMPIVYDNTQSAPAFTLVDAKAGFRGEPIKHLRLDAAVGSRNLTSATYYTEVFLNATGNGQGIYLNGPYNATFYGMLSLSYAL